MPSHLPADVRRRLEPIRLLVLDVDGVLTDGSLLYSARGEELKRFSVRDGLAIKLLQKAEIRVAVLTGRSGEALSVRCRELGIDEQLLIQGAADKAGHLDRFEEQLDLDDRQVAAMGDDLPDLAVLKRAGFSACPANAAPEVIAGCHYVCRQGGGRGAVREVAELLLKGQGKWSSLVQHWM